MRKRKEFSDSELKQLESLENLVSSQLVEGQVLERLMQPLPNARVWRELVKRLEWNEIQSLKANDNRIDAVAMVTIGEAWVAEDGQLESTWDGADDGKKKGVRTAEMLFTTDMTTGKLKAYGHLMTAAKMMLKLDAFTHHETERERFEERLRYWESIAKQNSEPLKGSLRLMTLVNAMDDPASGGTAMESYEMAKKLLMTEEDEAQKGRRNHRAHVVATELNEQCALLRSLCDGASYDDETWFFALNAAVNAARFCDRLEEVVPKGNVERTRQKLRHKGRNSDPFTDLVGNACEACYRRNPERPPYPREVLYAMPARTVWVKDRVHIAPLPGSEIVWPPMPVETFYAAKKAWAKFREVKMNGETRTPKVGHLPKPTTTLNI